MDKDTLIRDIRATHATIEAAAALDDATLLEPAPGLDGWTRKDVLAHVEWWHRNSAAMVAGVHSGVDPHPATDEPFDLDRLNARVLAESRDRSCDDVRGGEARSFEALVAAVEAATDEELFAVDPRPWLHGTLAEVIAGDSTLHYPDHAAHLAAG
jgi:hypothetical protein